MHHEFDVDIALDNLGLFEWTDAALQCKLKCTSSLNSNWKLH